jgi:hypothetical protein
MAWVLVGLQMEENSMTEEQMMIEAWVKKNKPKRYTHGERPEGQDPEIVSPWGSKKKSKAEKQAAKDAEKG